MLKEVFHDSFDNFEITRICMENSCKRDWMTKVVFLIQMLLTFGGRCNRYFWDIRLKILRFPNFNMLFQLELTKFFKSELFSCLPKVDHVIKSCKEPINTLYHLNLHFFFLGHLEPVCCFSAWYSRFLLIQEYMGSDCPHWIVAVVLPLLAFSQFIHYQ